MADSHFVIATVLHFTGSGVQYELSWVRVVLGASCHTAGSGVQDELSWVGVVLCAMCHGYMLSQVRFAFNTRSSAYRDPINDDKATLWTWKFMPCNTSWFHDSHFDNNDIFYMVNIFIVYNLRCVEMHILYVTNCEYSSVVMLFALQYDENVYI